MLGNIGRPKNLLTDYIPMSPIWVEFFMDETEFIEAIRSDWPNIIDTKLDQDDFRLIFNVLDPDNGEYDPLVIIDIADLAHQYNLEGKLRSLKFYEDAKGRKCGEIQVDKTVMND